MTLSIYYEPLNITNTYAYTPFLYWTWGNTILTGGFQYDSLYNLIYFWLNDDIILEIPSNPFHQYIIKITDNATQWSINDIQSNYTLNLTNLFIPGLPYECLLGSELGQSSILWLAALSYDTTLIYEEYTGSQLLQLVIDSSVCPLKAHSWLPFLMIDGLLI